MKLTVHFDGSCGDENPGGTAAYGFIVYGEEREILHEGSGRVGTGMDMTSNVAEFEGLYQAMLWVDIHYPDASVIFRGDSMMVVKQMNREYKAKKGAYLPYYHKTMNMAAPFIVNSRWTFEWVPREMNSAADDLSQYWRYREAAGKITG